MNITRRVALRVFQDQMDHFVKTGYWTPKHDPRPLPAMNSVFVREIFNKKPKVHQDRLDEDEYDHTHKLNILT
jgi:hypothetical protein